MSASDAALLGDWDSGFDLGAGPVAPTLVFAYGNPSRGDDALGPMLLERLMALHQAHDHWGEVAWLTDFQLQIENALDLKGRRRVLFIDAALEGAEPFSLTAIGPQRDKSFTTHSLSPAMVLAVYQDIESGDLPETWLLGVRGYRFELGETLSQPAQYNLACALSAAQVWLAGSA